MELTKYIVFTTVAECESISTAAKKLKMTQSGISHTIKRMETDMDLTLFYRNKNGVHLTPAGQSLLPVIQTLTGAAEQLNQTVAALHDVHKGNLTIGTFSSISIHWLPPVIRAFQQDYPEIHIHLKEGGCEDIENWIYQHTVDLGFLSSRPEDYFDWIPIMDDPLLAVLPKNYSLQGRKTYRLTDFNHQPFIMSDLGTDFDIHRVIESFSITPDVRFSSKDDYAIISMVAGGLGVSILPQLILQGQDKDVITLPLEPKATRQLGIGLLSKETASPAAKKFISYAQRMLQ